MSVTEISAFVGPSNVESIDHAHWRKPIGASTCRNDSRSKSFLPPPRRRRPLRKGRNGSGVEKSPPKHWLKSIEMESHPSRQSKRNYPAFGQLTGASRALRRPRLPTYPKAFSKLCNG